MTQDVIIPKPAGLTGYALHRSVAALANGRQVLWSEESSHVRVRFCDAATPQFAVGHEQLFCLRACVAVKRNRKRKYFPLADWQSRIDWLRKRAERHGFDVVNAFAIPGRQHIVAHDGREFDVDATDFEGTLRVVDPERFAHALAHGISSCASAFGLNLIKLD